MCLRSATWPRRFGLVLLGFSVLSMMLWMGCGGSGNSSSSSGSSGSGSSGSGSGGSGGTGGSGSGGAGGGGTGGGGSGSAIPVVQHVVIVVLENANYDDIVGNPVAPYINNTLIPQGGLASQYYANIHPSIGNYFTMITGIPYPIDDNFSGVVSNDNVARDMTAASVSWKVYVQSLPSQGYLGGDVYPYLRRHNPFSYLSDLQPPSQLNLNIVDFSQLPIDLANAQLPAYSFIVPDAEHDAHDCPDGTSNCDENTRVGAADTWLSTNLPQLLSNPQFQASGILILTTDESRNDITNGGGRVATVLVGSHVKAGYTGTGTYDHRSLLGLSMTALQVAIPNGAGAANQMTEFFQ